MEKKDFKFNTMNASTLQDLLPLIQHPSHYLGTETNRCKKDLSRVRLHMALAFPDRYDIAMSHFGIQILYYILNQDPRIYAERVFAPGEDMGRHLKAAGMTLATQETHTPLNRVDMVGFSLLYELNYTNVLYMLDLGKIPFFSKDRENRDPLVIAGGPCTCNPEPVADLFDAMVIGEAEEVILSLSRAWFQWKSDGDRNRETLLKMWSRIEGIYVPSFYHPTYDPKGFQHLEPKTTPENARIRRALVADLDEAPFPVKPVVPFGKPIHDRLRLEIARGCTRGCRFCQAGILYRPVRERAPDTLLNMVSESLPATGYDNISLLSLSTGDYTAMEYLMENLMGRCERDRVALSLPSMRAGTLTPGMMQQIKRVRKTGFTIAPEAGSQRLRNVVNKNLTEAEIVETVQNAFELGWQTVKLYFMIGLPFETDADLEALTALVRRLVGLKAFGGKRGRRRGRLNVSVATFIPKPHTPFQWAPQLAIEASREKIFYLKSALQHPGIHFKWQSPEISLLEGLWARGDRRLGRLLVCAYEKGCLFDGWTDRFRFDRWMEAVAEEGVDLDFFTTRARNLSEPLPWDIIDTGVSRAFLRKEWERAKKAETTPDCRAGVCHGCGVCDFEKVKPELHEAPPSRDPEQGKAEGFFEQEEPGRLQKYRLYYSKTGPARYFGHLEMVKLILQGIRRAGIRVAYSRGYHPKPKIAFGDPLPVGMESEREAFDLWVRRPLDPEALKAALGRQMPEGITIQGCRAVPEKAKIPRKTLLRYRIVFPGDFDKAALEAFQRSPSVPWVQSDRKGRVETHDLKERVRRVEQIAPNVLEIQIENSSQKTLRPEAWVRAVFQLSKTQMKRVRIVKCNGGCDDV